MSSSDKHQAPLMWSSFNFKNVRGAQEWKKKSDYFVDILIDWGYSQCNFLIYFIDVLLYVIFRLKLYKTKFSVEWVYEEETVVFSSILVLLNESNSNMKAIAICRQLGLTHSKTKTTSWHEENFITIKPNCDKSGKVPCQTLTPDLSLNCKQ